LGEGRGTKKAIPGEGKKRGGGHPLIARGEKKEFTGKREEEKSVFYSLFLLSIGGGGKGGRKRGGNTEPGTDSCMSRKEAKRKLAM